MKKRNILFALCFAAVAASAQPTIQWQKTFGGSSYDEAFSIKQTTDDGFVVAGTTTSNNGDIFGSHGGADCWVLKLNNLGVIQWKKALGGTGNEEGRSICQTFDNGFLLAGFTESNNYDVSGNHGGGFDAWVVKLSSTGTIQWQKAIGGTGWDEIWDAEQTTDNGYILAGRTNSIDGDVTENKGKSDLWVVKLDETGNIQWQKTYGGSADDGAYKVTQTPDGGFALIGETASQDFDVIGNNGNFDFWVLKLSSTGTIEWQKTLGGGAGDIGSDIVSTADGDLVVCGFTGSYDSGDVTGHQGFYDYWVVKLNSLGEFQWQKTAGGSDLDWARGIVQAKDGGYIVIGSSSSTDGDVLGNDGGVDFWLIKLSESGELLWQQTYGGTKADHAFSIANTTENGFIMCGYAWSTDGDVAGAVNLGKNDYWIVKLSPENSSPTVSPSSLENTLDIFPNPAQQYATIKVPSASAGLRVVVSDMLGREVSRQATANGSTLDIAKLVPGLYQLAVHTEDGRVFWGKLEKL